VIAAADDSQFAQIMRPLENEFAHGGVFGQVMPGHPMYQSPANVRSCMDCGQWYAPAGIGGGEWPEQGVPTAYRCMSCREKVPA
jgi:hypothetical protein